MTNSVNGSNAAIIRRQGFPVADDSECIKQIQLIIERVRAVLRRGCSAPAQDLTLFGSKPGSMRHAQHLYGIPNGKLIVQSIAAFNSSMIFSFDRDTRGADRQYWHLYQSLPL